MAKDKMKRTIIELLEQMNDEADIARIYKIVEYIVVRKINK